MTYIEPTLWAQKQFGQAHLNDPRRTQRLVALAASLAEQPGVPVSKLIISPADMEGAYRFIRNEQIKAEDIAEAGFYVTAQEALEQQTLLALEDTTSLSYSHRSIQDELGHSNQGNRNRAMFIHSTLLFAPETQVVVGLIEQQRWTRDIEKRGQGHQYATRPYKEKESYKWEQASRHVAERLGEKISDVISVCDREADLFEYLTYKQEQQQRFLVRSMQSRCIKEHDNRLYDYASKLQSAGERVLDIPQKGGRKARTVHLDIKYAPVTLKSPANKKEFNNIPLYYVGCIEQGESNDKLAWHLLTSEPVTSREEALKIVSYYEQRWLIEDFHKVWKSEGTQVEQLRMQSKDNLERLSVILAFIATRLLQLRFMNESDELSKSSCEPILKGKAWKLMWLKLERKGLPKEAPDISWAYRGIARLGGWKNTKRTGRASIKTLWQGWFRLQTILEGYELAKSLDSPDL
ncbi:MULTISPECIES: IS4-like element ISVa18 family transposase [Vibrio]|uniref:Transposase n=5 Tax=Vibrio TaxID=662 RepID=A0A0M0HS26_9VIBR|nr:MULTISPECIES: IS4-like element ISVa18 family transposase [Vibrio]ATC58253.1 IS4 family transposase ISVa18 [Vibrio anguillarum]ATC58434.1 IS4 family transposase ISVa18 [Vibrio anguillarum]ATC58462.1 IS4 family transposase ISVa18 [Vibrio anguillarum]EJL6462222.1 IS4-like element ISVa18 family transposase [Vibrio cholerae]KOO04866.1 transposase [Vibrio hepatarius]